MKAPVFWTDLWFLRGGENEACRKSNPNDNSVDYYHVVENIYKLKDCQALLQYTSLGVWCRVRVSVRNIFLLWYQNTNTF